MKIDESITGTPNGVMKAKTLRRPPEDQSWRAEEVFNIRGIRSNPVPGAGGDRSRGMRNVERMSMHQNKSVRRVTLAQNSCRTGPYS